MANSNGMKKSLNFSAAGYTRVTNLDFLS